MAGYCSCDDVCPESKHCIAIFDHKTGECAVPCSKDLEMLPPGDQASKALDRRVDIETRVVPLARLAEFLSLMVDADLFVPAARLQAPITLNEKSTTLESVIRKAGILIGPSGGGAAAI